jgi:signal transduction histidine kinase
MPQIALASLNSTLVIGSPDRWAHDIRNTLATVGLHLETLERLSGAHGREIAHAAHALMSRAAALCNDAMSRGVQADVSRRPRPCDIGATIEQLANVLRPTTPDGFEIRVAQSVRAFALADQQDVFRILFNLIHNAVALARRSAAANKRITFVSLLVERQDQVVAIRISDDGPGLPRAVRANLFRRPASETDGRGMGLLIARELAERNGGALQLGRSAVGATFVLELPLAPAAAEQGALRLLGRRAQH